MNSIISLTILLILFLTLYFLFKLNKNKVKYHKAEIDGEYYLVRDLADGDKAAELLGTIKKNILELKNYLMANIKENEEYKEYIIQLADKIIGVEITESEHDSIYTSYSVNKGEKLVFCLRSKETNILHDINLLMYVALHEIAHIGCPEYGHTELFKKIFAYFVKMGIKIGIYEKIDFEKYPVEYCGLRLSESII